MLIDSYAHIFTEAYVRALKELAPHVRLVKKDNVSGKISIIEGRSGEKIGDYVDVSVEERLRQMDNCGIETQVLALGHPQLNSYWLKMSPQKRIKLARANIDSITDIAEKRRGRFIPVADVPILDAGLAIDELRRSVKDRGAMGIQLCSTVNAEPFDLPKYRRFFREVAKLGIPILVHPTFPTKKERRSYEEDYGLLQMLGWDYEETLALVRVASSGMLDDVPGLKFIWHHTGSFVSFFEARIERYLERLGKRGRPMLDYFRMMYYDTAIYYSTPSLECAATVFGPETLIFGTDYPFGSRSDPAMMQERLVKTKVAVDQMKIPEEAKERIFNGNAMKLFNISR